MRMIGYHNHAALAHSIVTNTMSAQSYRRLSTGFAEDTSVVMSVEI